MNREELDKFMEVMSPKYPIVFRSLSKDWIPRTININDALTNRVDNIYFLWWVNTDATHMADADIKEINYIRLDIDIKKWVKESLWADIDRWDILWFIDEIKELLDKDEYLKEYSYIIFSWWGCHIYYSNTTGCVLDDEFTPRVWKLAMKRIYALYDKIIDQEYLNSDKAVCNAARIMRMPWTINQKHWEECTIIYKEPDRQSRFLWMAKALWIDSLEKNIEAAEKRAKEIALMREELIYNWWADTDIKYAIINKFPSYIIAQLLLPQFIFDWKKNFKDQWKLKWYYYVSDSNSICNWWSAEFWWGTENSCWNNFALVQRQLDLSKADTFKFFEQKFNL